MDIENQPHDGLFVLNHKVGVKLLDEGQLRNVFPGYDNLLNKIEIHRKKVSGLKLDFRKHYQYNLMYDNVFSILGKRGTGKTSVAFTLMNRIKENGHLYHDQVLPIIIPEVIPDDCSMLGWILAVVKDEIQKLEEELDRKEKYAPIKEDDWANCRFWGESSKSPLSKKVDELLELYFAGKYNPSNEASYYKAVGNSAKQAENYYQFSKKIVELWSEWVEMLKRMPNGKSPKPEGCPMIYFIFDDVDLAPEKVSELLSIIIKYLSHPNIIVITTADETLFLEVIENKLDKNIGRLPKEWRNYLATNQSEDNFRNNLMLSAETDGIIAQTARLYLGKVLPTSTRYYLSLYENCEQKQQFKLDKNTTLFEGISSLVENLIICLDITEQTNFMYINGKKMNFYLNFFGATSRQIVNTYLGAKELVDHLIAIGEKKELGNEEYLGALLSQCQHFLYIAINTNHRLAEAIHNIDGFITEILLNEYNQWRLFINYHFLRGYLKMLFEDIYAEEKESMVEITLQLYSLLFFVENLLLLMEQCRPVTGRMRIHGTFYMTEFLCTDIMEERYLVRTDLEYPSFMEHYSVFFGKLHQLMSELDSSRKFNTEYFYDFLDVNYEESDITVYRCNELMRTAAQWFGDIIGRMFLIYGNSYLIGVKDIEQITVFKDENLLFGHQSYLIWEQQSQILEILNSVNLYQYANEELKSWEKSLERITDQKLGNNAGFQAFFEEVRRRMLEKWKAEYSASSGASGDVPLKWLLGEIEAALKDKSLEELFCLGRESFRDKLLMLENEKMQIGYFIKDIINVPERWDNKQHRIYFNNMEEAKKRAKQLLLYDKGYCRNSILEILNLIEKAKMEKSRLDYGTLRTVIAEVQSKIEKTPELYFSEYENYAEKIKDILDALDLAINLEDEDEFFEVVQVGYAWQILKCLQPVYFASLIKERYESSYSPRLLENVVVRDANGKKAGNKKAYYYRLYELLCKVVKEEICLEEELRKQYPGKEGRELERERENLEENTLLLRNFVIRAVNTAKQDYFSELMDGMRNE